MTTNSEFTGDYMPEIAGADIEVPVFLGGIVNARKEADSNEKFNPISDVARSVGPLAVDQSLDEDGNVSPRDPSAGRSEVDIFALLTKQDEYDLWKQMQLGSAAAARLSGETTVDEPADIKAAEEGKLAEQRFVCANQGLVRSIINKRFTHLIGQSSDWDDLVQEGNKGLIHAVGMFDASKGFKFSTYATSWIIQSIQRFGAKNGFNHISANRTIELEQLATYQSLGLDDKTTASKMGISLDYLYELVAEIENQNNRSQLPVSLDAKLVDADLELKDTVGSPDPDYEEIDTTDENEKLLRAVEHILQDRPHLAEMLLHWFSIGGREHARGGNSARKFGLSDDKFRNCVNEGLARMAHPTARELRLKYLEEPDDTTAWQNEAHCKYDDPNDFFLNSVSKVASAKMRCEECPVKETCAGHAIDNNFKKGVWGGLSEKERRAIIRNAKTKAEGEQG